MPWRLSCLLLAVLCLNGFTHVNSQRTLDWDPYRSRSWPTNWNRNTHSDIEFDKEPVDTGAGSGAGLPYSDDEDFVESGSGSGSGMGDIDIMPDGSQDRTTPVKATTLAPTTTTSRPLTPCETMRQTSQTVVGKFVPRCLPNGDFDSLQCHGHPGTGDCYCVDLEGREIPGTLMEAPNFPNCEEGYNLPPCVHQMVKHVRNRLLGSFRPKCTVDGQFDRVQCHGSMCYCVDESTGSKVMGTEVHIPDTPNCDDDMEVSVPEVTPKFVLPDHKESGESKDDDIDIDSDTDEPELVFPEGPGDPEDTIDLDTEVEGGESTKTSGTKVDDKFEDNRSETGREQEMAKPGGQEGQQNEKVTEASEIMTQPGILAGIIGGSVVLLLCLVLLVMFIIYRMRKKDEGSYPLDEPRKTPNYNYVRAPDKEFYA